MYVLEGNLIAEMLTVSFRKRFPLGGGGVQRILEFNLSKSSSVQHASWTKCQTVLLALK